MSTRSITVVKSHGKDVLTMYRQSDGYPSGHGQDLADFLTGFKVVNGLGGDNPSKLANGAGCLAAQIVARFKEGAGGIYLVAAGQREEYVYTITVEVGQPIGLRVEDEGGTVLFDGKAGVFDATAIEAE